MTCVYALSDPTTGAVCYVGKSNDPQMRLRAHCAEARRYSGSHRAAWIRSLLLAEKRPALVILERCLDFAEAERRWIAHFRSRGCQLTNATDGGDGGGTILLPVRARN